MASTVLGANASLTSGAQTDLVPVNIRANGDDGLTLRLEDAMRKAFADSKSFMVTDADASRYLVVTISRNVAWKEVGGRTRVFFEVEYAARQRERTTRKGECWEDQLKVCAALVLQGAPKINMA